MKVHNNSDNKNPFLFFNENQTSKKNTKIRTELKKDIFNFNTNDFHEFCMNNNFRSKPRTLNYPSLSNNNFQKNGPQGQEQNYFNPFLQKQNNGNCNNNSESNSTKERLNINIFICSPEMLLEKMNNENGGGNDFLSMICKNEKNCSNKDKKKEMDASHKKEKESEEQNDTSLLKKNKNLFDFQSNSLDNICGQTDIADLIKEISNCNLNSKPNLPTERKEISMQNKSPKIYDNDHDKYYINDKVIKNKSIEYDLSNPYLYDSYSDYKSKEVRDDDIL